MNDIRPLFENRAGSKARIAVCLSGTGSNAKVLLQKFRQPDCSFEIAVLFTDQPETSAAVKLAQEYDVACESLDICKYYAANGEDSVKLDTPHRRELRKSWSGEVWEKLKPYNCDFVVFAGFVPLNDLPDMIPCLNVHPGDLTVEKDGKRLYAGLHYLPVENAILNGEKSLRSSVILVPGYSKSQVVDGGPVLGISAPMEIDFDGAALEELKACKSGRTAPPYHDKLRDIAGKNVEKLKYSGDHVVLPQAVEYFASGRYGVNEKDELFCKDDSGIWNCIETVEFFPDGQAPEMHQKKSPASKLKQNGFKRLCKYLYIKMVRGTGSPDYIARGWALGMFVGCVVPVFCQLIVSVPLSFVFRCSKIGAVLGTFITTPPTAIFIYPVLIWVGNKVINGNLSADSAGKLLEIFNSDLPFIDKWQAFADTGGSLVAAFFAGGLLWAVIMTPLTYFGVRFLVVRYRKMREALRKRSARE
ncbi:MAG: DUF2062 domain-containing protein [Lentisphaerae bacterium]|nr:DUF2062 domain-containing protein [Lentisphaerota bacterium]